MNRNLSAILFLAIILFPACSDSDKTGTDNNTTKQEQVKTEKDANVGITIRPGAAMAMGTPDLDESIEFWGKLGFRVVVSNNQPYPYAYLTDGGLYLGLHQDGDSYLGYTLWDENAAECTVSYIEAGFLKDGEWPELPMVVVITPDSSIGMAIIGAKNTNPEITLKSMAHMLPDEFVNESAYPNSVLGVFGELALPVDDLKESIKMWEAAGLVKHTHQGTGAAEYAILTDGEMIIGLHPKGEFLKPGITYFQPDATKSAKELKKAGVEIKDMTDVMKTGGERHFIIKTPEGHQVFMFSF